MNVFLKDGHNLFIYLSFPHPPYPLFLGEEEEKQQYSTHKIYHAEMKDFELVGSGLLE